MQVKTITVVGAGQLGSGIAQVGLTSGLNVILRDISDDLVNRGVATIKGNLERQVERGRMTAQEKDKLLSRLTPTTDMRQAQKAQVVIEAVFERFEIKRQVLVEADSVCPPETILASNTSSIPITKLAAATKRPEKVIGMHFMHPVPIIGLLEIVRGYLTSDDTYDTIVQLGKAMGRKPIRLANDYAGFANTQKKIRSELDDHSKINELLWQIIEGKRTPQQIEASEKMGLGEGMSPLAYVDFIGLDTWLNIGNVLFEEYGLPKLYPCPLLRRLVEAGQLGIKTGVGFYDYSKSGRKAQDLSQRLLDFIKPLPAEVPV